MRSRLALNAKNLLGRRTRRKIVVLAVDDYGNVRLHSAQARAELDRAGLKRFSRYDVYDTLETSADFHALFDVLDGVRDRNQKPAVITALSIPTNIDFERMSAEGYEQYHYELLPVTYQKLGTQYQSMMELWKQGIRAGLICPEFHGREHYHVQLMMEKLRQRDPDVMACFANRCYTSLNRISTTRRKWTASYSFESFSENAQHRSSIFDGLKCFEAVFGFRATVFNSPSSMDHHVIYQGLEREGIRYIEKSTVWQKEHQGSGKYRYRLNYTGQRLKESPRILVRNCVFEPTDSKPFDWIGYTLLQIATAFRWGKPAIISSHRVNFCGAADENNRTLGLNQLTLLLTKIVKRWPDVEFMTLSEMADTLFKYNCENA